MTSSGGGRACAGGGVKGHSRDDRPSPFNTFFNGFFQRRKEFTRGTLAHGILETRLCRVALLSNHTPLLPALIICLAVDVAFLGALRCLFLPRTRIFARREVGPAATPAVLEVRRFRLLRRRAWGVASASARALARSLIS